MLNLKKGLAVALAAATALTFAPVSAFAGTYNDWNNNVANTMNSTGNQWTFAKASTSYKQVNETASTAYVLLTPSHTSGSVTFKTPVKSDSDGKTSGPEAVTVTDTFKDGVWIKKDGKTKASSDADKAIQVQASRNSDTLNFTTSLAYIRAMSNSVEEIDLTADSDLNDLTDLAKQVKIIIAKNDIQLNTLKVTLSEAKDGSFARFSNHETDDTFSAEARPSGVTTANSDVTVTPTTLTNFKDSSISLNLKSNKDATFKVESNADVEYKSDDESIATIDRDGIHAKKAGKTTVYIKTKENLKNYGVLTAALTVNVIDQPQATLAGPDDVYVHGYGKTNAATIGVSGANIAKNTIKYQFVYWNAATQKYETLTNTLAAQVNPYVLDEAADIVYVQEYTGLSSPNYNWNAYLEATATAADGYVAPAPKYIRLHFDNDAPFELDAASQTLHVGESVQITTKTTRVATGAAFAYKSWNPAVATVSSNGAITAVGEGSTKIDVSYGGYTRSVAVTVKEYENGKNSDGTPVQVTGVTVSNKKGAAVKVTFDKSSIKNVKYYVQKKVSGKTSGKSVGSNKTTLSVKKGATVKVRVKAYYYDAAGNKLVGSYSAWKSLKTDKK